jgi:hypothetical protein
VRLALGQAVPGRAAIETALQQFTALNLLKEVETTRRLLGETDPG